MYRVMLIDDEENARHLLQASIDWEGLGLICAGEAASGIEAINIIDEVKPDIVFVDICMPFMNGIEFTKFATHRYPDLVVIVLTGFDNFEYARACVSLPVVEYMLKPIVRTEVQEVLERIVKELNLRRKENPVSQDYEEKDGSLAEKTNDRSSEHENGSGVDMILRYISENYTDSSINLTSVAQQFGFNASYLSRKFKAETGLSFVEYLIKCRMEKAMELARENMKMFCAAGEVGIPDPNYFGRCFKKYTGKSYSEFVAENKA